MLLFLRRLSLADVNFWLTIMFLALSVVQLLLYDAVETMFTLSRALIIFVILFISIANAGFGNTKYRLD